MNVRQNDTSGLIRRRGRVVAIAAGLLAGALALSSCGSDGGDEVSKDKPSGGAEIASPELIKAAKKEGKVVVYAGAHSEDALAYVKDAFEKRYGIEVQLTEETSSSAVQKVEAERRSGNPLADAVSLSDDAALSRWAKDGTTADAEVPVIDKLYPGVYKDTPHVPYSLLAMGIMYNSENVKEEDVPGTWEEFANLPSDTVIAMGSPATSGTVRGFAGVQWFERGAEFFKNLANHELIIVDSVTGTPALVITGEADYGVPGAESLVEGPMADGEPIKLKMLEGKLPGTVSSMAVLSTAPHPNAGKLFVQFHFSEQFARAFNDFGSRSTRADIAGAKGSLDLNKYEMDLGDAAAFTDAMVADVMKILEKK